MKTRHYFTALSILSVIAVVFRIVQVFLFTDNLTGFLSNGNQIFFTLIMILAIIGFSLLATKVGRCPLKLPRVNSYLLVASCLVGVSLINRTFKLYSQTGFSLSSPANLIELALNLIFCIFFFLYGIKRLFPIHIKRIFYITPLIYWLVTLIYSYVRISKMGLILENALMVLAGCATTFFFLYFAKVANNINGPVSNHTLILLFGSLSAVLCETFAIPQLLMIVFNKQGAIHNDFSILLIYFATGLFVLTFLFSFFDKSNLKVKRHRHRQSSRIIPYSHEDDIVFNLEFKKDEDNKSAEENTGASDEKAKEDIL